MAIVPDSWRFHFLHKTRARSSNAQKERAKSLRQKIWRDLHFAKKNETGRGQKLKKKNTEKAAAACGSRHFLFQIVRFLESTCFPGA
jgi:hypothetical protein